MTLSNCIRVIHNYINRSSWSVVDDSINFSSYNEEVESPKKEQGKVKFANANRSSNSKTVSAKEVQCQSNNTVLPTFKKHSFHKNMINLVQMCLLIFVGTTVEANKYVSTEEFINRMGLSVVKYTVLTRDGFIFTNFRIKASVFCKYQRVAVLLHGHSGSPRGYVMNTRNIGQFRNSTELCSERLSRTNIDNSLVLALSQQCFEVWLITTRGTEHGLHHLKYKSSSRHFWDWSYDEVTKYDLPASMDLIKQVSRQEKVSFIGYSMGGSLCLWLATNPKYERQLDSCILLGPVAPNKLRNIPRLVSNLIYSLTKYFGNFRVGLPPEPIYLNFMRRLCTLPMGKRLVNMIEYGIRYDLRQIDTNKTCEFITFNLASSRAVLHMLQIATTPDRKFHMYDFGFTKNLIKYRNTKPPEYNLGSIRLKNIVILYGMKDTLAAPNVIPNILRLLRVQPLRVAPIQYDDFQHFDFLRGKDTGSLVNYEVLKVLQSVHCGLKS